MKEGLERRRDIEGRFREEKGEFFETSMKEMGENEGRGLVKSYRRKNRV